MDQWLTLAILTWRSRRGEIVWYGSAIGLGAVIGVAVALVVGR